MSAPPIRALIADDHAAFLTGLRAVLQADPAIEVVGEASDGREAVALASALEPDVVVIDINMPNLDGIAATRQIVQERPHIAVLVLTMFDDDESVFLAIRSGARGYVVKGSRRDTILRAVHTVGDGGMTFGPGVARRIHEFVGAPPVGTTDRPFPGLTEREMEILDLVAAGRNNAAIAQQLGISVKTVRNHTSNVFAKLLVADRAEAIVRARDAGLGTSPPPPGPPATLPPPSADG